MGKTIVVFFILASISFSGLSLAEEKEENYCDDETSWTEWNALIEKYPDDQVLRPFTFSELVFV